MTGTARFRPKIKRPASRRRVAPGIIGTCPKCQRPLDEGKIHDCGEQLALIPEPPPSRGRRR